MAEQASDYSRGEMTIQEHKSTFSGFVKLTKWGSLGIAALLLLLTIWFCTTGGFLTGLISAVVVVAIGVLVLSEKHRL